MKETFEIKGVEIIIEYNEKIMDRKCVLSFLKNGTKSLNKFYEMEDAFDIVNEPEVIRKLFLSDSSITEIADLTKYISFCEYLGEDFEKMLFNTFGITIEKRVSGNTYELRGSKKGFSLLKDFL